MLALFTRRKETPMSDVAPETPSPHTETSVVMRFLTQGGAEVHITDRGDRYAINCHGCETHSTSQMRSYARRDANDHATDCRAMPKPPAA